MGKPKAKKPKVAEESFTVEKIISHEQSKNELFFITKWMGYPSSENSWEPESSFQCDEVLLEYWEGVYEKLEENDSDAEFRDGVFCTYILEDRCTRYLLSDQVTMKKLLAKTLIPKYGWSYMLIPHKCEVEDTLGGGEWLEKYSAQFSKIVKWMGKDYPSIEVLTISPFDELWTRKRGTFLPIPLNKMAFEAAPSDELWTATDYYEPGEITLSDSDLARLEDHLKAKAAKDNENAPIDQDGLFEGTVSQLTSLFVSDKPRLDDPKKVTLQLNRDGDGNWYLHTLYDIEVGTEIIPFFGEIVPQSEAEKCLREEGEQVAFASFIAIEKGLCLDRRLHTDLTSYIRHSCHPSCRVVLKENNGHQVPWIVAGSPIKKWGDLTLDWYTMFDSGAVYPDIASPKFVSEKRDHLLCMCRYHNCRSILWAEKQPNNRAYTKDKLTKLSTMIMDPFGGLVLHKKAQKKKILKVT